MKTLRLLGVLCVGAIVVFALRAVAGEQPFLTPTFPPVNAGAVLATDGGSANNQYTGTGTNTFEVIQQSLVTVQCREDSYVCVGSPTCDLSTGLKVRAEMALTTSCGNVSTRYVLIDAGVYTQCLVSNSPAVSDGGVQSLCYWKKRQGNEGP